MEIERKSSQLPQFSPSQGVLSGLSMVGGLGIVLAVLSLAFGVAGGSDTNPSLVGMGVLSGILLVITGVGGWVIATQPYRKFDNINEPLDDGHHGHSEPAHDDHAETSEHPQH